MKGKLQDGSVLLHDWDTARALLAYHSGRKFEFEGDASSLHNKQLGGQAILDIR